jgi:hypothetical protein
MEVFESKDDLEEYENETTSIKPHCIETYGAEKFSKNQLSYKEANAQAQQKDKMGISDVIPNILAAISEVLVAEQLAVHKLFALGRIIHKTIPVLEEHILSVTDSQYRQGLGPSSPYYSVATFLYALLASIMNGQRGRDQKILNDRFITNQDLNVQYRKIVSAVLYVLIHDCEMSAAISSSGCQPQEMWLWEAEVKELGYSPTFYRTHIDNKNVLYFYQLLNGPKGAWKQMKKWEDAYYTLAFSLYIPFEEFCHERRIQRKMPFLFCPGYSTQWFQSFWLSFLYAHQCRPTPKDVLLYHYFGNLEGLRRFLKLRLKGESPVIGYKLWTAEAYEREDRKEESQVHGLTIKALTSLEIGKTFEDAQDPDDNFESKSGKERKLKRPQCELDKAGSTISIASSPPKVQKFECVVDSSNEIEC